MILRASEPLLDREALTANQVERAQHFGEIYIKSRPDHLAAAVEELILRMSHIKVRIIDGIGYCEVISAARELYDRKLAWVRWVKKMMAVAMCDNTLTDTIAPAFYRKFTLEVTVSGSASAAATPVVLPASAGISGLKRRQNC